VRCSHAPARASTRADLEQIQQSQMQASPGADERIDRLDAGDAESSTDQSGRIADFRQERRELNEQLVRTEAYADTLRNRLQDQADQFEVTANQMERTEVALVVANQQVSELNELLEAECLQSSKLQDQLDGLNRQFENEVKNIRFELGAAEQTITDHETVNEQLTSELIDNQSFRQALESRLEQVEESAEKEVRELRQKVARLRRQRDDGLQKIENKDTAIAALLNELANRSSPAEKAVDVEDSRPHDTEMVATDRHEDRMAGDRITRLLIGNIDGQELRFPLFKDRLTIGRTTQNDIHLKAQYISRQHALLVTENDYTRIVDWGSKNGICVNRKRVAEQVLKSGDIVTIGTADFRYEERPKR
jgi:chromosome segregation ATPase